MEAERVVRISAIDNIEEIVAFFGSLGSPMAPDADLDRIERFEWLNRRELCLDLARAGTVTLIGPKVTAR